MQFELHLITYFSRFIDFFEIALGLWEFGDLGHELYYFGISLQSEDPILGWSYIYF